MSILKDRYLLLASSVYTIGLYTFTTLKIKAMMSGIYFHDASTHDRPSVIKHKDYHETMVKK
jgi:hypothetical protein